MKFLSKIPSAFYTLIVFIIVLAIFRYAASDPSFNSFEGSLVFALYFIYIFGLIFFSLMIINFMLLIISIKKKDKKGIIYNIVMLAIFSAIFLLYYIKNFYIFSL